MGGSIGSRASKTDAATSTRTYLVRLDRPRRLPPSPAAARAPAAQAERGHIREGRKAPRAVVGGLGSATHRRHGLGDAEGGGRMALLLLGLGRAEGVVGLVDGVEVLDELVPGG